MNLTRSVLTIFGSGVLFAALGGAVGYLLGRFVPDFYRGVFSAGRYPDFDPIAVGLGQGVTQGLMAGIGIGTLVVVLRTVFQRTNPGRSSESSGGGE